MSTKIKASKLHQATTAIETAENALVDGATGRAHGAALRAIDALHEFVRSIDQQDKEQADAAAWAAIEELQSMAEAGEDLPWPEIVRETAAVIKGGEVIPVPAEDERLGECTACGGPIFASETWSTDEGLMHQSCLYGLQEERERRDA